MATKEEIREYFGKERWSVLQGFIIFFLVVGIFTQVSTIDLFSYLISTCVLGMVFAKLLWWLIDKLIKESLKHTPNWYLRLLPTIFHLLIINHI